MHYTYKQIWLINFPVMMSILMEQLINITDAGNCPVTPVVQMLQGKWKLQILYELCIKCPMRFGELKKMLKPITNTALTNALKELEADDLIQRIQYNEMPLRVEYSLTLKGQDLLPVFYAIMQWGIKYIP